MLSSRLSAEIDICIQIQSGQRRYVSRMQKWECAMQGVAESHVRTWTSITKPHPRVSTVRDSSGRGRVLTMASMPATPAEKQASADEVAGRLW